MWIGLFRSTEGFPKKGNEPSYSVRLREYLPAQTKSEYD
jgi:hypothetical protein